MSRQSCFKPFVRLTAASGVAAIIFCLAHLSFAHLDLSFLLLTIATAWIGSRLTVKLPSIKGEVTVADTLIFLTALRYGGEAAIRLATVEAVCSSLRVSRKARVVFC